MSEIEAYKCDICGKIEEPNFILVSHAPANWRRIGKDTHYCPDCWADIKSLKEKRNE